ncbi:MAG: excinuclease ABC subunit UvrB [Rikenellaceae bacterium]
MNFKLSSEYKPTGDQPQAIAKIVTAIERGDRYTTLLGVTGSGKTFTVANAVAELNRPTLVLCHNKTLAAQLYTEFKNFFPDNAVEYYVSYYDYYQPEAYLPTTGTYIEKDLSINDEIEKMRLSTTATLLSGRRDVIVVSSVSCIYGIGNPEDFKATSIIVTVGDKITIKKLLYRLVEALYTRTETELASGTFRVNGETIDIMSAYGSDCYRITIFDDEIEMIETIVPENGARITRLNEITISPANLFVTTKERIAHALGQIYVDMGVQVAEFEACGRTIEAQRLKQRVEYDLEMIKELGYCSGIENYSRYFDNRKPGVPPFCLLNYFPEDFITVVDESHVTLPQIRGMHGGDGARKENLVNYGFRLEAARDNRPLSFEEYERLVGTSLFVSATPGNYEKDKCSGEIVEQLIRPTGLIDPTMVLRDSTMQIDDLVAEIQERIVSHDKVIITTITKRMSEELSKYFDRIGIRNRYIHSDIDTIERVQILEDLRNDMFDVLIGVNLLREGIDLPEVALVAILDADKEGFLRNKRSLIQIAGRAARHSNGNTLLYGKYCSDSMAEAIMIANRQRMIQILYNLDHKQLPKQAKKSGSGDKSLLLNSRPTEQTLSMGSYDFHGEEHYMRVAEGTTGYEALPNKQSAAMSYDDQIALAKSQMEEAAKRLDFLEAAKFRDLMRELEAQRDKAARVLSYK